MIVLAAFVLASSTFHAGAAMPKSTVYVQCGGQNVSPELHWSGAPEKTRSFALIAHDPDAPAPGGWYHWVAYNIPASTHALSAGAVLPSPSQLGKTSFGETAYGGPCPPPGKPHHYNFTLYALDVPDIPGEHLTGPELKAAILTHTLARTTVTGLYGR